MSLRLRPNLIDILGEILFWTILSWVGILLVGAIVLNYRSLNVTGLIPMLRSVGDGISMLLKSYWPFSVGMAAILGTVIARKRNP